MPPDPPRRSPTVVELDRRVVMLEGDVMRQLGIIGRELGKLNTHIAELVEGLAVRDHMDSQTDFSIRPDHARFTLRNIPAWAVVAVFAIVAGLLVALVLVVAVR